MIKHNGDFACQLPDGWELPLYRFGQAVQIRGKDGRITGLDYYTKEVAAALETSSGWWYFVYEPRTLPDGRTIADVGGYHESVIQLAPCSSTASYDHAVAV